MAIKIRAPKELGNASALENEYPISKLLPYKYHYDPATVVTQDDNLLRVFQVKGVSFETASDELINKWYRQFHQFMMQNSTVNVAFWTHIIKERDELSNSTDNLISTFAKTVDHSYKDKLIKEKFYRFNLFITVVVKPEKYGLPLFGNNFKKRNAALEVANEQLDNISYQLVRLDHAPRLLQVYEDEATGKKYSETFSFLSRLISGQWKEIPLSQRPANELIANARINTGKETLEFRTETDTFYAAAFGFKDYPADSDPLMLSEIFSLPFPFILAQSFAPIDRETSLKDVKRSKRILDMTDEDDKELVKEINSLIADISSRRVMMGEHNFSLFIYTDSDINVLPGEDESKVIRSQLKNRVSTTIQAIGSMNCLATREDLALNSQLFAMLPGNFKYRPRITPISSKNFSSFFPMHTVPTGRWNKKHWGDTVTQFKTRANTLYDFSYHAGKTDLGHTLIFGSSGAGKTTVQTFLFSQAEKFNAKILYFDYKQSCEIFINAVNGSYQTLHRGKPSGLNPYGIEPTKDNLDFLVSFTTLLAYPDLDVPAKVQNEISEIINLALADRSKPKSLRTFSAVYGYIQNNDLRERLKKWTKNGQHGWLFDNVEDYLSFDKQYTAIDTTNILDDSELSPPFFSYMTQRAKELYGQRFFMGFEEFWKMLSHDIFKPWIKDELKIIRRMNGVLIASTQDTNDVADSELAATLRGQCPTRIFFPNYGAERDVYATFEVSDIEFNWIKEADQAWREFLLKQGSESTILSFDIGELNKELAVLSGRQSNIPIMRECIEETSNNPDDWLPLFYERYLTE